MTIPNRPGPIPYDALELIISRLNQPDVHRPRGEYAVVSLRDGAPQWAAPECVESLVEDLRGRGSSASRAYLCSIDQHLGREYGGGIWWHTDFTFCFCDSIEEALPPKATN